jgi:hypothetical protein
MWEESMNGGSTRRLADGEWSTVSHLGSGESDAKGKEASAIGGFYSRRRERGLAAGPHIGVDDRCQGSPAAAAASGRACASPVPG